MLKKFSVLPSALSLLIIVGCAQSDPVVTAAVKSKLAIDDTVQAYQIDVDTAGGVVTLSGTVETAAAKNRAVMIARQTDGVRDVVDHLTVNPQAAATVGELIGEAREAASEAREGARQAADATKDAVRDARETAGDAARRAGDALTDAAITTGVKGKLLADTAVSGLKIDVDTKGGVVTLNGTVTARAEADRAVALARETNGVTGVVNNLRVGR